MHLLQIGDRYLKSLVCLYITGMKSFEHPKAEMEGKLASAVLKPDCKDEMS